MKLVGLQLQLDNYRYTNPRLRFNVRDEKYDGGQFVNSRINLIKRGFKPIITRVNNSGITLPICAPPPPAGPFVTPLVNNFVLNR